MGETRSLWENFRQQPAQIILSWLWFFLVLFSYYCFKPLRDALQTKLAEQMTLLYLLTFVVILIALALYSLLVTFVSRKQLLFWVHLVMSSCLVAFYFAIPDINQCSDLVRGAFHVWASVMNLYLTALFWSAMADLFSQADGRLWFGTMAAAGSIGSIAGSQLAGQVARGADPRLLLLVAAAGLELAVLVGFRLIQIKVRTPTVERSAVDRGTGGDIFAGFVRVITSRYLLAICCFVVLGKFAATFIFNNMQLQLKAAQLDDSARTILFSDMNFRSQLGSFLLQGFAFAQLARRAGVTATLAFPCIVYGGLFIWLAADPRVSTWTNAQVWQQIVSYGLLVPAQTLLFTIVSREDKYKTKGFIDTVVFRASDVAAAYVISLMTAAGLAESTMAWSMLPIAASWLALAVYLGVAFRRLGGTATSPSG